MHSSRNVRIHDLPHVYARPSCSPWALAYILGKSLMPMLQPVHVI